MGHWLSEIILVTQPTAFFPSKSHVPLSKRGIICQIYMYVLKTYEKDIYFLIPESRQRISNVISIQSHFIELTKLHVIRIRRLWKQISYIIVLLIKHILEQMVACFQKGAIAVKIGESSIKNHRNGSLYTHTHTHTHTHTQDTEYEFTTRTCLQWPSGLGPSSALLKVKERSSGFWDQLNGYRTQEPPLLPWLRPLTWGTWSRLKMSVKRTQPLSR